MKLQKRTFYQSSFVGVFHVRPADALECRAQPVNSPLSPVKVHREDGPISSREKLQGAAVNAEKQQL